MDQGGALTLTLTPTPTLYARITQAVHPITTDVLHQVFSRFGNLSKVLIYDLPNRIFLLSLSLTPSLSIYIHNPSITHLII
jgi:hypothetical protein